MSTTRMEAFSDGVIAVAITLLVLDLHVPEPGHGGLGHALLRQWPLYAAYITSFITLGIIWINHHVMVSRLRRVDHVILMVNMLLLMAIVVLPFATSMMSAYLKRSTGQHLAAAVYSGSFLAMSLAFVALNRLILLRRESLLAVQMPLAERRRILVRGATGIVPYLVATALAALSAYLTLAICAAVAFFYALPIASGASTAPAGEEA